MKIRTTLHLDTHTAALLDRHSKSAGMTRSKFVISLMNTLIKKAKQLSNVKKAVRYQNRNSNAQWKRVHIKIEDAEYSFLVEMRCFYRFSVSALIYLALHNTISDQNNISNNIFLCKDMDKNQYYSHRILDINNDMSILWQVHWRKT